VLLGYFEQLRKRFELDRPAAIVIAGVDEQRAEDLEEVCDLAAWTLVGRALLNLDEAISKE
jgi:hypothetical protein